MITVGSSKLRNDEGYGFGNMTRADLVKINGLSERPLALFIDDGGVMNDNNLRAPEWRRLIGEFMPSRMGGTPEQWASANQAVFPVIWQHVQQRFHTFASHQAFYRTYATGWMREMCSCLGVAMLPEEDAITLYSELAIYVGEREDCSIEGAASAVDSLHHSGYRLFTASGTASWELRAITARMGLAETFLELYGPDLVDYVKYGPEYYERVFAHAGVQPRNALVIESDKECCRWAIESGANAVWIDPQGRGDATSLEILAHTLVGLMMSS